MMWAALRSHSLADWRRRIKHSLETAQYAVDRLQAAGVHAWRNENSITVVFPCPSERISKKYCLATSGNTAHLIATPHHHDNRTIDALIDEVIADLQQDAWRSRRAHAKQVISELLPSDAFNFRTHYLAPDLTLTDER